MYKYYPAILVDKKDAETICNKPVEFKNNRPADPDLYETLENYFAQPIVQIHQSAKQDGTLILIAAPGAIQTNPITNNRIVMLDAPLEDLKIILQDIFDEHPEIKPENLYDKYSFKCPVSDQFKLHEWFKRTFATNVDRFSK